MCIICIEFQRQRDLADARMMLRSARREPTNIPRDHLDRIEQELDEIEREQENQKVSDPST